MKYKASFFVREKLLSWYEKHHRSLPWRETKDPYKIWVSETMLQQTVSETVKPYYKRFLKRFPTLKDLSQSDLSDVFEMWAGLGYYSRAERLRTSAQIMEKLKNFPRTYKELISLPGLGDYTARAVSSLAFNEPVGVVDSNVIRVLSRFFNLNKSPWTSVGKKLFQDCSDSWVQGFFSSLMNQALMELGATICSPKNPSCLYCPLRSYCKGFKNNTHLKLPKKRKTIAIECWSWSPCLIVRKRKLAFLKNKTAPFLKGRWIFPGPFKKLKKKPLQYDFQHSITHHKIFITIKKEFDKKDLKKIQWFPISKIRKINPSSLIQKIWQLEKSL